MPLSRELLFYFADVFFLLVVAVLVVVITSHKNVSRRNEFGNVVSPETETHTNQTLKSDNDIILMCYKTTAPNEIASTKRSTD